MNYKSQTSQPHKYCLQTTGVTSEWRNNITHEKQQAFYPLPIWFYRQQIYHHPAILWFRQVGQIHWWWIDNRCHIHGLYEGLWQGATWTSQKDRSLWHRRATAGWIRSFLTRRKTTNGIPQGSVLWSSLFVLFINDLPDSIQNNSTVVVFADDTKLFARTDTSKDKEQLQEDLDFVCKWSSLWLLKFHPDKYCH